MDPDYRTLMREFKRRIPPELARKIRKLIVFGSRVKGGGTEESDLDVLALVDVKDAGLEERLSDIAYTVMWDNDFKPVISLFVLPKSKFDEAYKKGFSFYRHVVEEGVAV